MKIHEYQAKEILKKLGVPVPKGRPAFSPDEAAPPPAVERLRHAIAASDVVLFCTPEYAGALPGSFKNLLDWTVGGGEIYEKPVAWINVAGPGRGEGADATLRTVLTYVGAKILVPRRQPVDLQEIGNDIEKLIGMQLPLPVGWHRRTSLAEQIADRAPFRHELLPQQRNAFADPGRCGCGVHRVTVATRFRKDTLAPTRLVLAIGALS